jgi:hypothetical protein
MTSQSSHSQQIWPGHRPPLNELPVPVTAKLVWRSEGVALAIPSLLVYTTGIEMYILYRTHTMQATGVEATVKASRAWRQKLVGLTINGVPVEVLGTQYFDFGSTTHVWSSFEPHRGKVADEDLSFKLDWPEFADNVRVVRGVYSEIAKVTILW